MPSDTFAAGIEAHFQRMQDMARRYLEPITYVASFPRDNTKWETHFEEPDTHHSEQGAKARRDRMTQAFVNDIIHMLDGPEQRALTPTASEATAIGAGEEYRHNLVLLIDRMCPDKPDSNFGYPVGTQCEALADAIIAAAASAKVASDTAPGVREAVEHIAGGMQVCMEDGSWRNSPISARTAQSIALAALSASPTDAPNDAQVAPDGWKLVPIKPTDEMTNAGIRAWLGITKGGQPEWNTYVDRTFAAMLAASPAQVASAPDRAGVDVEVIAKIIDPIAFKSWQATYNYSIVCGDGVENAVEMAEWSTGKDCALARAKATTILAALSATPSREGEQA